MSPPGYAVIKFLSDDTYSEIPVMWLADDEQFCYWPKASHSICSLMRKAVPADHKTWDKYAISVEGKYQTLQQARRKAMDSECPTTTTDDEHLGKGKRKRKKTRKTRSPSVSSSQSEDDSEPLLFEVPTPPEQLRNNTLPVEDITLVNITTPVDICETVSVAGTSTSSCYIPQSSKSEDYLEKIYNLCCNMHMQLLSIEARISKLESGGQLECPTQDEMYKTCVGYLPLKDVENMQSFNKLLQDDAMMAAKYVQYINNIGGRHTKDIIHRVLKKTFTNELGVLCSWLGQRNNVRLCDLQVMKVIKEVVEKNCRIKEKECEVIVSEWFRLSKLRLQREQKPLQNVSQ